MASKFVHHQAIRTPFPLSHIQVACNGDLFALPFVRTSIGVWNVDSAHSKPQLELEGHKHKVCCLVFSHSQQPTFLCSAAEDYVIIWNVAEAKVSWDKGDKVKGKVIAQNLGPVQYCSFSGDDEFVAVCADQEVFVLNIRRVEVEASLEGHDGRVTCAEFCPHYTSTLVTAGEDRTFKIWNLKDKTLVYQSTIVSSSPFLSMCMSPDAEQFALGTADGIVRIYDLSDGGGFKCLHLVDIPKLVQKKKVKDTDSNYDQGHVTISSRPSWRQPAADQSQSDNEEDESEAGYAVEALHYTASLVKSASKTEPSLPFLVRDTSLMTDLLDKKQTIIIGTTGSLLQINSKTLELCSLYDFQDPIPSVDELGEVSRCISVAGCYAFSRSSQHAGETWCVIGSLLQNVANIVRILDATSTTHSETNNTESDLGAADKREISVLSREPLCANSPLKAELVPKAKTDDKQKTSARNKKGSGVQDQPLTFKSKVKSSGYTDSPRTTMFQPKTQNSSSPRGTAKSKSSGSGLLGGKEYPMNKPAPTQLLAKLDPFERPTPVNNISFSGDGQLLACGLANKSGHVFKMPLNGKGFSCAGHNGSVRKVHWSSDSRWLLTCSDDKTACIWSRAQGGEPVMYFNTVNHNFAVDKDGQSTKVDKSNPLFSKEIKHAQFYYMDKFVLVTSGNTFNLYKYHIDLTKASDVKRYLTKSRYKLVNSFQMTKAQQITSLSAINGFYSYIVMCAGTNKSLEVFDLNVGQSIRVLDDVHARPVHAICQNEGSAYVSHPDSAYDLFLTAAASDCVKLWDLRTNRCVHRYEGHQNRTHSCGIAFSPCTRYIACGSEDKCAYLFDTRTGSSFHKLTGHTDVVSDVAFHPLYPQLATGTLDGKFHLFSSP